MAAPSGMQTRTTARSAEPTLTAAPAPLAVIIVNFCQWNNCRRLLRQLGRSQPTRDGSARIVVLDNGSPGRGDLPARASTTIIRNATNEGFARGVNRAAQAVPSDWLLLLNPDVSLDDRFLEQVLQLIDDLPQSSHIGVLGFAMKNPDGTPQASTGRFPTLAGTLLGMLRSRANRKYRRPAAAGRSLVDWATGGCLLVRRACFQQLGGFDERYFLYYEDVDFCRRAAHAGWQVAFEPRLQVTHHWPLHRREVPPGLRVITRHALLTYARTHWPGWNARMLAGVIAMEAAVRGLVARCCGKTTAMSTWSDLRRLVRLMQSGQSESPRSLIARAAATLRPVAAAQDIVHVD